MRAILVANRQAPGRATANALLDAPLGAEVVYVDSRDARTPTMNEIANHLRTEGRRTYVIPIGASTPLGALGYVLAVAELVEQMKAPDVIMLHVFRLPRSSISSFLGADSVSAVR